MASKSKRARLADRQKKKTLAPVLIWSLVAALVGYLQNSYGQFSDIRGFYGMRFLDGQHSWPYESYTSDGATNSLNPIEYPAVTGMVVWLLTFFVPKTGNPIFNYFAINAFVNALLFLGTTFFVRKMTDNKHTYLYIFAPAVVLALNLNWDLWAMLPMLASIHYFDRKNYTLSGVLLGLSIAAKFFPIVLLLPASIHLLRSREIKTLSKYIGFTTISWLIFNLPVLLTSYEGWKYFYKFSFSRGLGDGSVFSVLAKTGFNLNAGNGTYYALNVLLFGSLIILLFKSKTNLPLSASAFLAIFVFTYFGKQYSMQYIIWLCPLSVILIAKVTNSRKKYLVVSFISWQMLELLFRISYFENLLTNVYSGKPEGKLHTLSDQTYGIIGLARYIVIVIFVAHILYEYLFRENTLNDK